MSFPALAAKSTGYATLHAFQAIDGITPLGELVQGPDGNLYGTNFAGGTGDAGTLFRVTTTGKFAVLHVFTGPDGHSPSGGLALGADGNFYGVTGGGGEFGNGTAFRMTPGGAHTLLHSFGGPANDGSYPYLGALVQGADGSFYGTTSQGGAQGLGVVFRMTPAGDVSVLHAFAGGQADGAFPRGGVVFGSDGLLHGTTLCGGVADAGAGCGGVLYSLSTAGVFRITHRFAPADAPQAPLLASGGFVYGTTSAGGAAGAGTVFKASVDDGRFNTLHEFAPSAFGQLRSPDGAKPLGRLLLASDGNLYGTTSEGGIDATTCPGGDGTIFKITPSGAYGVVQALGTTPADGSRPYGGLVQGRDGRLYGLAHDGAADSHGTVFKLALPAAN